MEKLLANSDLCQKLARIKCFIVDVDGILTDGKLYWGGDGNWIRHYHVHDGYGLKLLMKYGVRVAVITTARSQDVKDRVGFLGLEDAYFGSEEKDKSYADLLAKRNLKPEETSYMGDDLFDLPVLKQVGFSATVPEAVPAVKKNVHYITERPAGAGAVREVIEALRSVQKLGPEV